MKTFGPGADQNRPDLIMVDRVRKMVRIKSSQMLESGRPIIAGSFSNWEAREMIPIVEFCEAIDSNKPDPISILKKQGRIREDAETEADLKTEKERAHLDRVKEQIKQEYKLKWKNCIIKSLKYKRA